MKRTLRILALLCLSAIFLTVSALADSGPKDLLTVKVENAPEEGYYLDLVVEGEYEGHTYGSGESEYSGIDWSYSDEEAAALDTELLDALRAAVPEGYHAWHGGGHRRRPHVGRAGGDAHRPPGGVSPHLLLFRRAGHLSDPHCHQKRATPTSSRPAPGVPSSPPSPWTGQTSP